MIKPNPPGQKTNSLVIPSYLPQDLSHSDQMLTFSIHLDEKDARLGCKLVRESIIYGLQDSEVGRYPLVNVCVLGGAQTIYVTYHSNNVKDKVYKFLMPQTQPDGNVVKQSLQGLVVQSVHPWSADRVNRRSQPLLVG